MATPLKDYPAIGLVKPLPSPRGKAGPKCDVCAKPARFKLMIETSLARVDDIGPFRSCDADVHHPALYLGDAKQ